MAKGLNWEQSDVDRYLQRFNRDRAAVQVADVESHHSAEGARPNEADKVYPRFRIHVHHRTRRLSDASGRSYKAAVDGIVRSGILRDDNPKYLEGISESYEQSDIEETILTLQPVKEEGDG